MKKALLISIVLTISITIINAQWMELVTPKINYEIKSNSFIDLGISLEGELFLLYDCEVPSDDGEDSDWKLFVQKYDPAN